MDNAFANLGPEHIQSLIQAYGQYQAPQNCINEANPNSSTILAHPGPPLSVQMQMSQMEFLQQAQLAAAAGGFFNPGMMMSMMPTFGFPSPFIAPPNVTLQNLSTNDSPQTSFSEKDVNILADAVWQGEGKRNLDEIFRDVAAVTTYLNFLSSRPKGHNIIFHRSQNTQLKNGQLIFSRTRKR
jgi:hypothetical protein